ncbi:sirohydrochlorin chelatase [Paenibacillus thalictri]|uniref:Cobalamin biosynthesis protein CbiX n=1 Tax=Paenibacillus thalictri TaxID=2527873 RepID=A0A4Q9DF17_9BACL|nr:CbiX/SirB N-terminal domain-containing protein [Paenibacillus thalictri]TBL68195.1 cobalamin biosynthesis protein CbiX [Paenibacillus thalictri]
MLVFGVLVISHGSQSEEWVRLVDEAVAGMRLPERTPVFSSFLEIVERRLIQDGIDALEAQGVTDIIAVPLFISSGSTHIDEISYALGVIPEPKLATDMKPFRLNARIHFADPIGDDSTIAEIVYDKLRPLSSAPDKELVLLVGHGSKEPGFYEKWADGLASLAGRIQALGGFAEADTAMLLPDQAGQRLQDWREKRPELQVIVAPLFLSEGYFTSQVVPERLQGYSFLYNGKALLPDERMSRWLEQAVLGFLNR